jgi:hypothetical protein
VRCVRRGARRCGGKVGRGDHGRSPMRAVCRPATRQFSAVSWRPFPAAVAVVVAAAAAGD